MKMPNCHLAFVERSKIVEYLLNAKHPHGSSKARFFAEFGFHLEAWEVLGAALRQHGQGNELARRRETGFGLRYEVDGELKAPDGRRPSVRTI